MKERKEITIKIILKKYVKITVNLLEKVIM